MTGDDPLPPRPPLVGVASFALSALERLSILPETPLEVEHLRERARRQTGLVDFGDSWFEAALAVLVAAVREEAALNPVGRFAAAGQFLKLLRERLWTQHWFAARPEILAEPLPPPIVVVGAMRSGTTRLHRLLAADERFAHMRFFETVCPVPPPEFRPGGRDTRPRRAARILSAVHRLNPRTAVIHPTGPFEPEEELGLLVQSAWGMKHEAQWRVPSYGRWMEGQDATPAYHHLARLLRLVRWARGDGRPGRPWVLKTPQHMLDLPALLRVFPGAKLIFIHRDPAKVVGSSCSLVWNQMAIHSDQADPRWIGTHWLDKTGLQIERMRAARAAIAPAQRMDVLYRDMDADWEAVMRRVYGFLDMDIAPAQADMHRYIERANRQHRWRHHRYDLAAFGLQPAAVRERFASYARAFDLEPRPTPADFGAVAPAARRRAAAPATTQPASATSAS